MAPIRDTAQETIKVRPFVEALLEQFETSARTRRVTLDALVFSDELELDPALLRRLLTDLVGDALRRAPAGTSVSVVVSRRGAFTEFRVADEGAGIAVQAPERIFKAGAGGLREVGAVLTLCRLAAEAHGGRLSIAETDRSTVVCLAFPSLVNPAPETLAGIQGAETLSATQGKRRFAPSESGTFTQAGELAAGAARPTVLVVDDEPLIRTSVLRVLKDAQYNVLEADCAERALALLKSRPVPISLLLSDVGLPGVSGAELVRQTHQLLPELPTLLMSASAKRALVADGVLEDNTYLLQKPFSIADLLAKVEELLTLPVRRMTGRALSTG
jgi:CheY-like chemotaxis protein